MRVAAAAARRPPAAKPTRWRLVPAAPLTRRPMALRASSAEAPCCWHARPAGVQRRLAHTGGPAAELYDLLGVEPSASPTEIKDGFLAQVKLHHPDVSPNPDAAEVFDKIKKALEVLSDPQARKEYDAGTCGVQPDWVYGEDKVEIPLGAMSEGDLRKKLAYLEERIRSSNENIDLLGRGANAGGVQMARLVEELNGFSDQRREIQDELQKIAASKFRKGGNRGRKKASERLQTAGAEWWDVPDNPTHYERMQGGGRRAAKVASVNWDPYLRGEEATIPQPSKLQKEPGYKKKH